MGRISRSWQLVKASWAVLRADKELVLFPVISSIAGLAVLAVLLLSFTVTGGIERLDSENLGLVDLALLFVFYIVGYSVVVFFNAALIGAANIRLEGGDPTVRDGLRIAFSRLPQIVAWAVIAATVGLVLRMLAERGGAIGFVVSLIGGVAWALVTFLVVPVVVVEGIGPIEALKRSASLLRQTWGEQIVGNFSIGLVIALAFIGVIVVGGVITVALASVAIVLGAFAAVVLVGGLIVLALVGTSLAGIFNVALYRYAVGSDPGSFFPRETLAGAFRQR